MRRVALFVAVAACTSQGPLPPGKGRPHTGPQFDASPAATAPTAPVAASPTPAPVAVAPTPAGGNACEALRLPLGGDTVIAKVDGSDVLGRELGDELERAEKQALRSYCDTIAKIREQSLDGVIDERLLAKAADGGDGQAWLRKEVEKTIEPPTEAEITAFYEQNKSETAPPLELVRDQVINAIVQERTMNAASAVLDRLRKGANIERMLPDVRMPPPDLGDATMTAAFGPKDAKVHVVEFSDFECPYCARAAVPIAELKQRYGDRVHFSYRHFPLSFHPNARPAAEAAQCAVAQDKFWAFHDAVFARSSALGDGGIRAAAEEAGLDLAKLDACLASGEAAQQVEADMQKAQEAGVEGTPSFFLNGRSFDGGPSELAQAIEAELQKGS